MNIISDQIIELHKELTGLLNENLPVESKYLLRKLFRDIQIEYNDLISIYSTWEHSNKGKSFSEFINSNKNFEKLPLEIKDVNFIKQNFASIDISKYPVFNRLCIKI
jgi:hypothetical protein